MALQLLPLVSAVSTNNSGTTYSIKLVFVPAPPPLNANGSSNSRHLQNPDGDQFGAQLRDSTGFYGLWAQLNSFDGGGNPASFSWWLGSNDNKGYFYQDGMTYWPSCSTLYTVWAVDNYNGGSLGADCPAIKTDQYNFHVCDSCNAGVTMFIYQGQWWAGLPNGNVVKFPNGNDGASYLTGYFGTGGVSFTETGSGTYNAGYDIVQILSYITKVTLSGSTFTLYLAHTHSLYFENSGTAPPNSIFTTIKAVCPYEYSTSFYGPGSLPGSGSSLPTCG